MRLINIHNYGNIPINRLDNGISLKLEIGRRINIDAKILTLYHDGSQINENNYIPDDVENLDYQENNNAMNDIILKIEKNYCNLPKFIQISSDDTICEVKRVLSNITSSSDYFDIFDEEDNELKNNQTLAECNLVEKSRIVVCKGGDLSVQLKFCCALSDVTKFEGNFPRRHSVFELQQLISAKLAMGKELKLALFTKTNYLSETKKLFNYPLNNGDTVYYVDLNCQAPIEIGKKLKKGKYATVMEGKCTFPPESIILYRYAVDDAKLNSKKVLQYEIITRLNVKPPQFVMTISMFQQGRYFYIAMEQMQCSLKSLLREGPLDESQIIHYGQQILEALHTMHELKLLHRNMRCSSVLLDSNDNVKLCNFHLTKHLPNETTQQLLGGIPQSKIEDSKMWVAPEVLRGERYGFKADIWSFGATLIEMLTGKRPYPDLTSVRATFEIISNKTIMYDRTLSVGLNGVVDLCIAAAPEERASISELIDKFREM